MRQMVLQSSVGGLYSASGDKAEGQTVNLTHWLSLPQGTAIRAVTGWAPTFYTQWRIQYTIAVHGGYILEKNIANGKTAMREVKTLWEKEGWGTEETRNMILNTYN
jgi:hypothetical protein